MKRKLGIQDFADIIEQREGISHSEAENFVRTFFDVVEQGLEEEKFVKIKGLGTFKLIAVSERESVNINTGERFQISGHTKISFTPDAAMKELINRPFAHFEAVDLNEDTDTREFEEIDEEMETESSDAEGNDEKSETDEDCIDILESEEENELLDIEHKSSVSINKELKNESTEETESVVETQNSSDRSLDKQQQSSVISDCTNASDSTNDSVEDSKREGGLDKQAAEQQQNVKGDKEKQNLLQSESASVLHSLSGTSAKHNSSTSESNPTQGYVYGEVPSPRKRNWWKIVALLFGLAILMTLSYFAGYYRMLCPHCGETDAIETNKKIENPQTMPIVNDTSNQRVSTQNDTAISNKRADTSTQEIQETQGAQDVVSKNLKSSNKDNKSEEQVGKPCSVVPNTHVVVVGDNVYRIARRYYGSDKYAERIIRYNNIKDANTIVVGMKLKLPRP